MGIKSTIYRNTKMKKLLATATLFALLISNTLTAQVAINTDGSAPDASAMLDVKSTIKGFLLPNMTHAEMYAISTPATGLMVFNTTDNKVVFYNGISWMYVDGMPFHNCGEVYTDTRDGNTYNTISINGQCWFAENLKIGSMINGSTAQTNNGIIEKYCFDNNTTNCDTYGGLYQWNEMMQYVTSEGTQGICPTGWHIPTDAEWTALTNYAGGLSVAGGKLKETGTSHWLTPNTGATNEYGFTNLPAGYHNSDGNFHYQTSFSYTWSSAVQTTDNAWGRRMNYDGANVNNWSFNKEWGLSIRCIQD